VFGCCFQLSALLMGVPHQQVAGQFLIPSCSLLMTWPHCCCIMFLRMLPGGCSVMKCWGRALLHGPLIMHMSGPEDMACLHS
jgi:hypothetical protein